MQIKILLGLSILLFITSCSGGGSGGTEDSQNLVSIDSAAKAENTLYEIGKNSSDLFTLTQWAEMLLEEISNQLVETEEKEAISPYHDLKLACPFKGTMLINGSITIDGATDYDINVLLDNCYFDTTAGLKGNIKFKGAASQDAATNMEIVMKDYHIGLHMLKETTVNATIKIDSTITYKMTLSGTVLSRKEDVKYSNFTITIDESVANQPQALYGIYELIRSDTTCMIGKYKVNTQTALTDTGKIKVNNATFNYMKDDKVEIIYTEGKIVVDGKPELLCP